MALGIPGRGGVSPSCCGCAVGVWVWVLMGSLVSRCVLCVCGGRGRGGLRVLWPALLQSGSSGPLAAVCLLFVLLPRPVAAAGRCVGAGGALCGVGPPVGL